MLVKLASGARGHTADSPLNPTPHTAGWTSRQNTKLSQTPGSIQAKRDSCNPVGRKLCYLTGMNPAEVATALVIEQTLNDNPAFRKVEEKLYVIKQGSAYVTVTIVPWGAHRALVRCVALVVKGIDMDGELALRLMKLNAKMRFGAFAYDPSGAHVLFAHSILGGATLDREELLATLRERHPALR